MKSARESATGVAPGGAPDRSAIGHLGARRSLHVLGLMSATFTLTASPRAFATNPVESAGDARPATGDGVHGRFDGDFALGVGPEGLVDPSAGTTRLGATFRAMFYQTVGLSIAYEQKLPDEPGVERALGLRVHVSPLFLLRFQSDLERGPATLDLLVDSLELFGGPVLLEPPLGPFASNVGADVGLGFGVPLCARATGFWLHPTFLLRFAGDAPSGLLGLSLRYQFFAESPLVRE